MKSLLTYQRRYRVLVGLALVATVAALAVSPLHAQAQQAPALTSLSSVLSIHGGGQTDTLIVLAELPQGTPLPAEISVAVPKGAKPDWVGEIVGTDPSKDPTAQYTITPGKDYDIATVSLTRVGRGQIEITVPGQASGSTYQLSQPIIGPVANASVSLQVPAGSAVSSLSQGLVSDGSSGGVDRYTLAVSSPKPGSVVRAQAAVKPAAAGQTPQTGQVPQSQAPQQGQVAASAPTASSASSDLPWMTILVLASAAFFGYNLYRYRQIRAVEREQLEGSASPARATPSAARRPHNVDGPSDDDETTGAEGDEVEQKLKALGDQRSRGELSREEYLAKKQQLRSSRTRQPSG